MQTLAALLSTRYVPVSVEVSRRETSFAQADNYVSDTQA